MKQNTMTALAALAAPAAAALPFGSGIRSCTVPGTAALTFDDGPSTLTPELLDLLAERGVKATFFINGDNTADITNAASGRAEMIKRIVADGHQLASHGWAHITMSDASKEEQKAELNQLEEALVDIVGKAPTYYRPPFGDCDAGCVETLKELEFHNLLWDVDSNDWRKDLQVSKDTVSDAFATRESALVLAHDIHEVTVRELAPFMIEEAEKAGLQLVTVGQCLGDDEANWYRGGAVEEPEEDDEVPEEDDEDDEEVPEEDDEVPEEDDEQVPEEDDEQVPEEDDETPEDDGEETPEDDAEDDKEDDKEDDFENNPELEPTGGAIHSTATLTKIYTITSCPNDKCEDGPAPTDAPHTSTSTWTTVYTITTCDDDKCEGVPEPTEEPSHSDDEHVPETTDGGEHVPSNTGDEHVPAPTTTCTTETETVTKPTHIPSSGFTSVVHPTNGTSITIPTHTPHPEDEGDVPPPASAAGLVQLSGFTLIGAVAAAAFLF